MRCTEAPRATVPEGSRAVATGERSGTRGISCHLLALPRRGTGKPLGIDAPSPRRGESEKSDPFHGFRAARLRRAAAPPVATFRRPGGAFKAERGDERGPYPRLHPSIADIFANSDPLAKPGTSAEMPVWLHQCMTECRTRVKQVRRAVAASG